MFERIYCSDFNVLKADNSFNWRVEEYSCNIGERFFMDSLYAFYYLTQLHIMIFLEAAFVLSKKAKKSCALLRSHNQFDAAIG